MGLLIILVMILFFYLFVLMQFRKSKARHNRKHLQRERQFRWMIFKTPQEAFQLKRLIDSIVSFIFVNETMKTYSAANRYAPLHLLKSPASRATLRIKVGAKRAESRLSGETSSQLVSQIASSPQRKEEPNNGKQSMLTKSFRSECQLISSSY